MSYFGKAGGEYGRIFASLAGTMITATKSAASSAQEIIIPR
jgi:hypothetical protein